MRYWISRTLNGLPRLLWPNKRAKLNFISLRNAFVRCSTRRLGFWTNSSRETRKSLNSINLLWEFSNGARAGDASFTYFSTGKLELPVSRETSLPVPLETQEYFFEILHRNAIRFSLVSKTHLLFIDKNPTRAFCYENSSILLFFPTLYRNRTQISSDWFVELFRPRLIPFHARAEILLVPWWDRLTTATQHRHLDRLNRPPSPRKKNRCASISGVATPSTSECNNEI